MPKYNDQNSVIARVHQAVEDHPHGINTFELVKLLKMSRATVTSAATKLKIRGLISKFQPHPNLVCTWKPTDPDAISQPAPVLGEFAVALPRREGHSGHFTGITWTNEISRPGGEVNRLHGSLQADGSVKPHHRPVAMCVGFLKDKMSNGR